MAEQQNNQPVVAMPYDQYARQQLAQERAAMAETPLDRAPAGGRYIGADGKPHDAHGNLLEGNSTSTAETGTPAGPGELTDDFPAREALVAGGFRTQQQVREASDEELLALEGIGRATLEKI